MPAKCVTKTITEKHKYDCPVNWQHSIYFRINLLTVTRHQTSDYVIKVTKQYHDVIEHNSDSKFHFTLLRDCRLYSVRIVDLLDSCWKVSR